MKFRNVLSVILISLSLILSTFIQPVHAQVTNQPAGFKNVTLWLYPEYDDPRLLIMLEGKITGAQAPVLVKFLVPSGAQMYSAGSKDALGKYTGGPPDRKPSLTPGWDEISYELKTDTFRVEYYDSIITGNTDKKISSDFRWLYPISDLQVIAQVPRTAENFSVVPAGNKSVEDGFTVYTYSYNSPSSGQPLHFDIAYTKLDANPSISTTPANTNSSSGSQSLTPVFIFVGFVLVLAVVVWVIRDNKKHRRQQPVKQSINKVRTVQNKSPTPKKSYCDQCGEEISDKSRFCPHCGNEFK